MKKDSILLYVALIAVLCIGCKGRTSGSASGNEPEDTTLVVAGANLTGEDLTFRQRKKNLVEEVLEEQLDALAAGNWNPAEYSRLSAWIDGDELNLSYSARTSFRSLLDADYCISMDNEARRIMGAPACGGSHARLKSIMAERKKFDVERTSIGKAVRTEYDHHEEMMKIVVGFSAKQAVKSFNDKYDSSFETTKKNEAANAVKNYAPVCSILKNALGSPDFSSRRKDYCEQVLTLYERYVHQNGQATVAEKNAVEGRLLNTYGTYGKDKNKEKAAMDGWRKRLDDLAAHVSPAPDNY